jgi:hypothetical protein
MKRLILMTALLLLVVAPLHAHEPNTLEDEFEVENPDSSYALYGEFVDGDEVFTVRLSYEAPFAAPFEILVPRRDKYQDHRPAYALVGPGLAEPTTEERAALPRELPPEAGVFVEMNQSDDRPVIFESFTRRVFWSSGPIALRMTGGDYEIWIWSPEETAGPFSLGFGVEEDGDFSKAFDDWSTYAY